MVFYCIAGAYFIFIMYQLGRALCYPRHRIVQCSDFCPVRDMVHSLMPMRRDGAIAYVRWPAVRPCTLCTQGAPPMEDLEVKLARQRAKEQKILDKSCAPRYNEMSRAGELPLSSLSAAP